MSHTSMINKKMTNKLDILQSLYNATISTTETYRITITDSKKIYIKEKELTIQDENIRNRKIEFTINSSVANFKYTVNIYKIPYTFFGFHINKYLKYIAVINIDKKLPGYSAAWLSSARAKKALPGYSPTHTFTFNSKTEGGRDIIERLFDYIIDTDRKAASDKIEIYNKDLKKLTSKAVTRDDVLDKILK